MVAIWPRLAMMSSQTAISRKFIFIFRRYFSPARRLRMASRIQQFPYCKSPVALVLVCVTTVGRLAVLRGVFAATVDLRIDEAYYSTWSKEGVLSYLDHPPLIAWCIRSGTTLFGDTNFGVRFAGLAQLLLADIVRRLAHDIAYVAFAVLMPEASLHYGLGMAKVTPDIALIPSRLWQTDDLRWWLLAGLFGGLALLSNSMSGRVTSDSASRDPMARSDCMLHLQPIRTRGCGTRPARGCRLSEART